MACVNGAGWCKGLGGGGQFMCLKCQADDKAYHINGAGLRTIAPPVVLINQPLISKPPVLGIERRVSTPKIKVVPSKSNVQASSISRELAALRAKCEEARRGPESFEGKFAYRGVGSDPKVYQGRGGFKPHQISSIQDAMSQIKRLSSTGEETNWLYRTALRWQLQKDKKDGYFLSTGLSIEDSYDGYPYLYRIDIGSLRRRQWSMLPVSVSEASVHKCCLYTDHPTFASCTMIAITCLEGGVGRGYELLIMTPVGLDLCDVEKTKGSRQFRSCNDWINEN